MSLLLSGFVEYQALAMIPFQGDSVTSYPWNENIEIPRDALVAIDQLFAWGRGVIVVIGIIGVLFCAGKMAVGKFGRSDLAAEGVGGLVWTILGISLMLIAIPVITLLLPQSEDTEGDTTGSGPHRPVVESPAQPSADGGIEGVAG